MTTPSFEETIYKKSDSIISREIEGELLIIPISSGIGDMEDEIYSMNETGKAIWDQLDGTQSVSQIIQILQDEFEATTEELRWDLESLLIELVRRKMIVRIDD